MAVRRGGFFKGGEGEPQSIGDAVIVGAGGRAMLAFYKWMR